MTLKLPVPYYSQRDSKTGHALRMCYSSCCAMLLEYGRPGTLKGSNGDDQYLHRVLQFGDTVDANAQIQALKSYNLDAKFRQDLTWGDIDRQLDSGVPVPIGILHRGPVSAPSGGGHWIVIIGRYDAGYIVHDPFGEMDLINGQYPSTNGQALAYSRKKLTPRWRVNGAKGWGIIIHPDQVQRSQPTPKPSGPFIDVPDDDWAFDAIAQAYNLGLMAGYGSEFKPDKSVSRRELAAAMVSIYESLKKTG